MLNNSCIIGAGSSGITAIRALAARDLPFDCFEMGSEIGGNWRYNNDNGRSSAYNSLHIDTSKVRMQYSDLPMPDAYPEFPHHSQVLAYFEQYVEKFDLRRHITFRTRVVSVTPEADNRYAVEIEHLDTGERERRHYANVLVCNGHHWNPRLPQFPGEFNGRSLHSHDYRTPHEFQDEWVVVVGIGNSGADLASELSRFARRVYLSMRRNPRIIPRYMMGYPLDQWTTPTSSRLPLWLQKLAYRFLLKVTVGDQTRYGFPAPDHEVLTEHPTVSAELLNIVAHGGLDLKPNIERFEGNDVVFCDGSREQIDSIIFATGYTITFPFFDPDVFSVSENDVRLYRKVVSPEHPGLYFIGLIQPLGAIMPLAEEQAKWVAELIAGEGALPDKGTMAQEIDKEHAEIASRYVRSARHTIQVDYFPYLRLMQQEREASKRRKS